MTQRTEHSWNVWDYENRRTPVWVMMLTSASCCRHVQKDSACSFSVRQDSDISTEWTAPVYVIDRSEEQIKREDVIRRRHVLLRCADSNLNHEWSETASFVSCLDACLDVVGVRPQAREEQWYVTPRKKEKLVVAQRNNGPRTPQVVQTAHSVQPHHYQHATGRQFAELQWICR
jgi:ribosomal protein L39E